MAESTYLPRDFTAELLLAARLWRRMTRDVAAPFGVGEAGAAPLLWIGRMGEGVRQNAVAERIGVEGASLVRVIDELSAAGLVTRQSDPSDRRANLLHLTDKGREVTGKIEVELGDLRQRVLGVINAGDIAAAQRVFAAIKQAAETIEALPLDGE
ncbi:MAG TPA: MarR family winged helix-turn-helix transcriptional regulator [Devosiaceae bacterium]|nr:MarR family winged helix-turn-helix transcriptional regulator [Devosiaceae bacterium]